MKIIKVKYLFLIVFAITLNSSCNSQKNSTLNLEGKWKVIDWTYINFVGRSLSKSEKDEMNKSMNDLILDFKSNHTFSSNKPKIFDFLENKKFSINEFGEIVIGNNNYPFLAKDDKTFLLFSNIMLQIEKTESYKNAQLQLEKLPSLEPKSKNEDKKLDNVFSIHELDTPPKIKTIEFDDNCKIDCLINLFNSNMKFFIDYSEVDIDSSYFIDFIIDTSGKISNINIRSKRIRRAFDTDENKKRKLSATEKSIVNSILFFNDRNPILGGIKNGQKVNTKLNLELRLIPK